MYSQLLTQNQFKRKKFYHNTLIRFFLENALCLKNFQTILAIIFWQKYKNSPSPLPLISRLFVICFKWHVATKIWATLNYGGGELEGNWIFSTFATVCGQDCRSNDLQKQLMAYSRYLFGRVLNTLFFTLVIW